MAQACDRNRGSDGDLHRRTFYMIEMEGLMESGVETFNHRQRSDAGGSKAWTPEEKLRLIYIALGLSAPEQRTLLLREGVPARRLAAWLRAAKDALAQRRRLAPQADSTAREAFLKREVEALKQQLRQKEKALAETSALLSLSRKKNGLALGGRGRFHGPAIRKTVLALIDEAVMSGTSIGAACNLLELSTRTVQRWRRPDLREDRRTGRRTPPANRLSEDERRQVLALVTSDEYRGLSPRQIVPRLADKGVYLASESTIYRLLRHACHSSSRRGHAAPRREQQACVRQIVAFGPDQVWSWDISYLKGPMRGGFLYLYMVVDVWSRRIMGWQVSIEESTELAAAFIRRTCEETGVEPRGLVLHSDNGSPMKGSTTLATLRSLGIVPSFSRPQVSDDNPFSEALFRTLKRQPTYPDKAFCSLAAARAWVAEFVDWYNREHLHGGIQFVTPNDRHYGHDASLLAHRQHVYERARHESPARWAHCTRRWAPAGPVRLRTMPPRLVGDFASDGGPVAP
jgi:transposase InsO family protein